jgi:hypothetical protein
MVRTPVVPVAGSRPGWIALGMVVGVLTAGAAYAQTPPAQQPPASPTPTPAPQATPAKNPYIFSGEAAMTLNFIKADKTADFETVIGKLKDALAKSDKPERKQQAASWKIFKASEPGANGSVLYVSIVDPVVKGADYTVSTILAEAFPTEVQAIYKTYSDAYVSQNIINLSLVSALGK